CRALPLGTGSRLPMSGNRAQNGHAFLDSAFSGKTSAKLAGRSVVAVGQGLSAVALIGCLAAGHGSGRVANSSGPSNSLQSRCIRAQKWSLHEVYSVA